MESPKQPFAVQFKDGHVRVVTGPAALKMDPATALINPDMTAYKGLHPRHWAPKPLPKTAPKRNYKLLVLFSVISWLVGYACHY